MNLKIIHATLEGDSPRQVESSSQLKSLGERYIKIVNTVCDYEPPIKAFQPWFPCNSPMYGCYLSHKQSIMLGFSDNGHSLICEGDCKILDVKKFKDRLQEGVDLLDRSDYPILRFEPEYKCPRCPCVADFNYESMKIKEGDLLTHNPTRFYNQVSDHIFECDKIIGSQCFLVNEKSKSLFERIYDSTLWLCADHWLNYVFATDINYVSDGLLDSPFCDVNASMLAFKEKLTGQFSGPSSIAGTPLTI